MFKKRPSQASTTCTSAYVDSKKKFAKDVKKKKKRLKFVEKIKIKEGKITHASPEPSDCQMSGCAPPPPPPHTHTYTHARTYASTHTHTHTHTPNTKGYNQNIEECKNIFNGMRTGWLLCKSLCNIII